MKLPLYNWVKNISISRKLYFTVGIMALLIAVELFTLWFSIGTLSSVRAFVGGEGLWSKGQKDAIYSLERFGRSKNQKDYNDFLIAMAVSQGDHKARIELIKPNPDLKIVRQGFLEGRNHPDDIDGMIKLFRRFHEISYISRAIEIWTKADAISAQLTTVGEKLQVEIMIGGNKTDNILKEIEPINPKLTILEDDFSYTLGEGSRWLEGLILKILLSIALTVEVSGLVLTVLVSRGIAKGIDSIISTSKSVAEGDFSNKATIFSKDEIGQLAVSFNNMVDELQKEITALHRTKENLRKQQELYETLVNTQSAIGEGVSITEGMKFIYMNDALCELYGYTREELRALPSMMDIIVPEETDRLIARMRERLSEKNLSGENTTRVIKKDGTIIDIEYAARVIETVGRTQIVSIIRDITQQKKAANMLEENSEKLIKSNKELEQFAYAVSHDLREPLRTINSYVQLLESRYKDKLDKDAKELMQFAVDGTARMDILIHDLLIYCRISSSKQELTLVDCSAIVESVILNLNDTIKKNKAKIHVDLLPKIMSNDFQMTQLFQNLIINGIKFHGSSHPEIQITSKKQNQEWLFSIKDNGIGIDKKYAEKIFIIFQRLHAKNDYEGTGIGLAICKKVVELHGGKIWFNSDIQKGTTFYFTLKNMQT